jgi:RNA polymerase primary sigma factor
MRYGLNGENPRTRAEVGAVFNLGSERIRQLENQALKKLQARSLA